MSYAIIRIAKLKNMGHVGGSLSHTYRTIDTPNADASRTHLNNNSHVSRDDALKAIQAKIPEKKRKNAVHCFEYLITGSPEWEGWHTDQQQKYFDDAIKWLGDRHGAENVVVTSIQLDETTPHLVAYVVPLIDGKLNARATTTGKDAFSKMQTDFAKKVGKKYGLERGEKGSKAKHEDVKRFYADITKGVEVELELPKPKTLELSVNSYRERVTSEVKEQLADTLKSMQSQLTRKDKELKNVKQELKLTRAELEKVNERTKIYQDARNKLVFSGLYATVEFDKKIVSIANQMHNAYEQEKQARLAEQACLAQAEQARQQVEQARQAELARQQAQATRQAQPTKQAEKVGQVERSGKGGGMDLG